MAADISQVLGGLLLVVVFIAITVKVMNWRRLLRLERQAVEDSAERGDIAQPTSTSTDLPFGVKALNEGSGIEGVWDARTTTQLHGPTSRNRSPLIRPAKMFPLSKRGTSTSSAPTLDTTPASGDANSPGSWTELLDQVARSKTMLEPATPPQRPQEEPARTPLPTRKKSKSITISYSGPQAKPTHSLSMAPPETVGLLSKSFSQASTATLTQA